MSQSNNNDSVDQNKRVSQPKQENVKLPSIPSHPMPHGYMHIPNGQHPRHHQPMYFMQMPHVHPASQGPRQDGVATQQRMGNSIPHYPQHHPYFANHRHPFMMSMAMQHPHPHHAHPHARQHQMVPMQSTANVSSSVVTGNQMKDAVKKKSNDQSDQKDQKDLLEPTKISKLSFHKKANIGVKWTEEEVSCYDLRFSLFLVLLFSMFASTLHFPF